MCDSILYVCCRTHTCILVLLKPMQVRYLPLMEGRLYLHGVVHEVHVHVHGVVHVHEVVHVHVEHGAWGGCCMLCVLFVVTTVCCLCCAVTWFCSEP